MSLPPTYHSPQSNLSSVPTSPLKPFWLRSPMVCKLSNLMTLWYSFYLIIHWSLFKLFPCGFWNRTHCGFPSSSLAFPSQHLLLLSSSICTYWKFLGLLWQTDQGSSLHAGDVLGSTCRTHTAERVTEAGYRSKRKWNPMEASPALQVLQLEWIWIVYI